MAHRVRLVAELLTPAAYQTRQALARTIGWPALQEKASANWWQIRHYAVDAVLERRVRVRHRRHSLALRALVAAGPLRHADEEPLIRREAVDRA